MTTLQRMIGCLKRRMSLRILRTPSWEEMGAALPVLHQNPGYAIQRRTEQLDLVGRLSANLIRAIIRSVKVRLKR